MTKKNGSLSETVIIGVITAVGGGLAGAVGALISRGLEASLGDVLSAATLLATFAATVATFLTVREMRAVRVQSARARLTALPPANGLTYSYVLQPEFEKVAPPKASLSVRNASSGIGQGVHLDWQVPQMIDQSVIEAINENVLNSGSLRLSEDGFGVDYFDAQSNHRWRLPVSSSGTLFVGDLGPSQELVIEIPHTLLNHIAVLWLGLARQLGSWDAIPRQSVPLASLSLRHSSPYEDVITDTHSLRFDVTEVAPSDIVDADPPSPDPRDWRTLRLQISLEFTSPEVDALPQVVVA